MQITNFAAHIVQGLDDLGLGRDWDEAGLNIYPIGLVSSCFSGRDGVEHFPFRESSCSLLGLKNRND